MPAFQGLSRLVAPHTRMATTKLVDSTPAQKQAANLTILQRKDEVRSHDIKGGAAICQLGLLCTHGHVVASSWLCWPLNRLFQRFSQPQPMSFYICSTTYLRSGLARR